MSKKQIAAIILGAGKGTRMKSDLPKVMMPLCGKPMIRHIINTLESLPADKIVVVISPQGDLVKKEVSPYPTCVQEKQLGTCHAVLPARDQLKDFEGDVLVVFGDQPTYSLATFEKAIAKRREGNALVVVGFRAEDPLRYGRLIKQGDELLKIVEFKDASDEEKAINLCNSGMMCFDSKTMFEILDRIGNENAAGEYYLTDAVTVAREMGLKCGVVECPELEAAGIDTQEKLAFVESCLKSGKSA